MRQKERGNKKKDRIKFRKKESEKERQTQQCERHRIYHSSNIDAVGKLAMAYFKKKKKVVKTPWK